MRLLKELEKNNFPLIFPSALSVGFSFLGLLKKETMKVEHGRDEL